MLRLWKADHRLDHEELFLAHYEQLLGWALKLARQDRQQAEDLVHDVFVRFVVMHPALDEIENVEGYLFTMLRNLLRSRVAREARSGGVSLSLLDYDSAEIGLRSTDPRELMRVQGELRLICRYAIARREQSRAGSVMILRYFLGYYPSEISRILHSSLPAVDRLLSNARSEARLYLDEPDRLRFLKKMNQPEESARLPLPEPTEADFLSGLAREIFRSCQRACLPVEKIRALYQETSGQSIETRAIETKTLAHLVSCPRCLDHVNRILGLPLLSERYPTDTLGPDPRGRGGSGSGGEGGGGSSAARQAVRKFRRRLQEVSEHQPKELRVAVNGELVGTLALNSEVNKLGLRLDDPARISFIEILSEQNLGLFLLNMTPPPEGEFEQAARASFNHQRRLDVSLSFSGPKASLEVVYTSPQSATAPSPVALDLIESDPSPEPLSATEAAPGTSLLSRWRGNFERRWQGGWILRPGLLAVAISLALALAVPVFFRLSDKPVSAAELIQRSITAERQLTSQPGQALHRACTLEETNLKTGQTLKRQRIELWQKPAGVSAGAIKVRRLYNEDQQLIAGEWISADGSRKIYQRSDGKTARQDEDEIRNPQSAIRNLALWQLEPSAEEFARLIGQAEAAAVEENPAAWLISYEAHPAGNQDGLVRATLRLERASLRAVEQTLAFRLNNEVRAFSIAETSIDRHPMDKLAPQIFEPEPELLGVGAETRERGGAEKVAATPRPSVAASPIVATTELEVEALNLLDQAGANLREEVSVRREGDGRLLIEGVIESQARKEAIEAALAPLRGNPAIKLRLETTAEALARARPQAVTSGAAPVVQEAAPARQRIPAWPEVRRYLQARGVSEASLETEINGFANRLLAHSRQSRLHTLALRRLAQRFTPEQIGLMESSARRKYFALLAGQAEASRRELTILREELLLVFRPSAVTELPPDEINTEAALVQAALRLVELNAVTDDAILSAFSLTAAGGDPFIRTPRFWQGLIGAEALARGIQTQARRWADAATPGNR